MPQRSRVVEDVTEIPRLAAGPLLRRLSEAAAGYNLAVDDEFLSALNADLATHGGHLRSELLATLLFDMCRVRPADDRASLSYYEERGLLVGILETHLTWLLQQLPADHVDIGWAVLEEISSRSGAASGDLTEIAERFDAAGHVPPKCSSG